MVLMAAGKSNEVAHLPTHLHTHMSAPTPYAILQAADTQPSQCAYGFVQVSLIYRTAETPMAAAGPNTSKFKFKVHMLLASAS